ncbi:MAG: glycosyltransferase [Bacteroides sp.]|nr:glycosyltransferase [Bacteroides sp.]
MDFEFNLDPMVWVGLATAALAALLAFWTRFIPIWYAGSAIDTDIPADEAHTYEQDNSEPSDNAEDANSVSADLHSGASSAPEGYPKLSVIVYAYTEIEATERYIREVMDQDYPNFEVILVNEGSAETISILKERFGEQYPNLYITFIPYDAHNLSRRKLAYTVGMKAASGHVALTTVSNCRIPSNRWLSEMMAPFVNDSLIDVVLGYTHVDFRELHGIDKWYRQMDATLTACQWIGSAQMGTPYRGDCFNLAYKRELFFRQKGYSQTIHLVNGDDDIFLIPIMNGDNTAVAISPASILTTEWEEAAGRILATTKERYQFTARFLPKLPFVRAGIGSIMQWLTLFGAACAAVAGLPSYTALIAAAVFLTIVWTTETLIYRRTARRLESICLWWSFPLFLLWHPFGNLIFRIRRRNQIRKNYTFA